MFGEGGDPRGEAKDNWMKARRAILRSPLDRIGYGGYLKLASEWPGFIEEIQSVVGEFRQIHENMNGTKSYVAPFKVIKIVFSDNRGFLYFIYSSSLSLSVLSENTNFSLPIFCPFIK